MRYPFESEEAQLLNKKIFETIYYSALEASCELAQELGPYETYPGSPVSKGVNRIIQQKPDTSGIFFPLFVFPFVFTSIFFSLFCF